MTIHYVTTVPMYRFVSEMPKRDKDLVAVPIPPQVRGRKNIAMAEVLEIEEVVNTVDYSNYLELDEYFRNV